MISRIRYKINKFFEHFFTGLFFLFFFSTLLIAFLEPVINGLSGYDEEAANARADGFTISKYLVDLDVKKDNKVNVKEEITINFTSSYKHGIYKFTPLWLKYTGKDNNTIKRRARISNYRAVGDPYTLDTVKKKSRIKIGSAYEYVPLGEKTYVIEYTYDMGRDPFRGFDEFIFHAYGDYWGTEIKNASIHVTMPKNIEKQKVNFFTDKYRKENVTDLVNYTVKGNELTANFDEEKNYQKQYKEYCKLYDYNDEECAGTEFDYFYNPLSKSLTVDVELPEGYFEGGSWNYGFKSLITILIILFITGFIIFSWIKYGKNYAKKAETVEFYAPDGLDAAEVGYIYNNHQTNKKLTIGLIVQLASKGYIKIDTVEEDKKKEIQITKLVLPPTEPKPVEDLLDKRTIVVKKLKDVGKDLDLGEATMMSYLFKEGNTKNLQTNFEKFFKVKDSLVSHGYIEIVSDNEDTRQKNMTAKQKEYEALMKEYQKELEIYHKKMAAMTKLTSLEEIVYKRLFEIDDVIIISRHPTLYRAFDEVEELLKSTTKDKIHDKKATTKFWYSLIGIALIIILSILSYRYFEDLDPMMGILYDISFACIPVSLFFTIFMRRKTEYGELITARIKGFRHFLITCEKEQLEQLVEKDPSYFYNILPYTYVMNISKKWVKKFEDIPMPKVDMGNFDFSNDHSYYSIFNDVHYPRPVYTGGSSGSSSGCSSCGGGCSSCGGGCSSCGGGGSW